MAKDLFSDLIVKDPETVWKNAGKKPVDPSIAFRKKITDYVNKAIEAVNLTQDNPERGAYKTKEGLSRVVIKAGNQVIKVAGNDANVVPRDKLKTYLTNVLTATEQGAFDSQYGAPTASFSTSTASARPARSPEAIAAQKEKMAAYWASPAGLARKAKGKK